ncbi:MAG: bifunctional UDP-N-acetylglucosamine diphosphorylase/glucosamine-1-phosphate N-acetyltransferase GlmU [Acidobacteriota bacterium]
MSQSSAGPSRPPRIAVILAAGKGTRMRSNLPKPMHAVAGKPMLRWVIDAARAAGCVRVLVVVGYQAEVIQGAFADDGVEWVLQEEQLGTGHALAQAEAKIDEEATLLVLNGDVPGLRVETLERLASAAEAGWGGLAVANVEPPGALGRVLSNGDRLERIVEAADAGSDELAVTLVNSGLYAVRAPQVFDDLRRLDTDNAQGELYLTDAMGIAVADGRPVELVHLEDTDEALGINDRRELARMHRILIDRHLDALMRSGVTVLEPARTTVEPTVTVGAETVIHPDVVLLGSTEIGPDCEIHAGCWVKDSRVAPRALLRPHSVLEDADVGEDCAVGPFARLRPGAELMQGALVGNFVEVKKARLGVGSKASHLAYLGDADIGDGSNIGAGVVTCNYDGKNKHRTVIGDGAFVGSDSMLVAPVTVGDGATTAAGSTITQDVPAGALAVGRARQRNIPDWASRAKRRTNRDD